MPALMLLLACLGYQFPFTHINVCRGYGDWNASEEFHSGLDFRCAENELALNPYWDNLSPVYVLRSIEVAIGGGQYEWVVFMGTTLNDDTGWAYRKLPRLSHT
jgi:hypothetical protein